MSKKVGQIEYFVPKRNQNAKIYEGIFKKKLQIKVRIVENVTEEDVQKLVNLESHPNIQRIFGYEYKDSVFYIGLRSFDVTLNDFIKIKQNKRPKINNILLIKNITDGLKFLHDNGIVHDNISFKNVGIRYEQNIVLLCNYGFDDLQEEDFFVTPEHASFDFQKSYPADVFNLGIVIFFILTNGRHPFGELNDSQSIINNIFNTKFKCESRDFEFLKNEAHKIACAISLLNKMLKRKPEDRIICSEIVKDPLCWENREIYRFFREVNQSWKDYSSEDKTTINNKWTFIKNKYLEVNDERNLTDLVDDMVQKVRHFEESLFIDELRDEHILTYMEEFPLLLSFVYDLTSNTLQDVEEIEELTNEFSSAMNINSEDIQTTNSFNKNIYTGRFNNIDVSVRKIPKENSKDFDVELKNIKKLADRKKLGLECKSCKKVKCENVLKFFGYYDEPKFFCIVLEKIENDFKSFLSILMNDNEKNIPKVTKIMFDVVKGLECLHANSIAHLNLNSHSLMIVERNDVQIGCLANFGRVEEVIIAKESQGEKFNDMYIAPELKKKRKEGTKTDYSKCDIYSLGILFKTEYLSFLLNLNNPKTHDKEDLRKLRKEDKISFLFEELVNFATEETPLKRPNAEGVRKNPFFWDSDLKIQFLRDVTECYEGIKVKTKIIDKIEERALKKLFVVDIQQSIENSNSLDENRKNQTGGWMDFLDVDEEVLKEISKFIGRENRKNSKIALKKEKSIFTLIKLIISIYDSEGSDDFKTSRILLNAANPEEYLNYWLKKFELIGFLYYVMEEHMNKMYPTFYSTQTPKRILGNRRMSSVLVERPSLRRNLCEGGDNLESF